MLFLFYCQECRERVLSVFFCNTWKFENSSPEKSANSFWPNKWEVALYIATNHILHTRLSFNDRGNIFLQFHCFSNNVQFVKMVDSAF